MRPLLVVEPSSWDGNTVVDVVVVVVVAFWELGLCFSSQQTQFNVQSSMFLQTFNLKTIFREREREETFIERQEAALLQGVGGEVRDKSSCMSRF